MSTQQQSPLKRLRGDNNTSALDNFNSWCDILCNEYEAKVSEINIKGSPHFNTFEFSAYYKVKDPENTHDLKIKFTYDITWKDETRWTLELDNFAHVQDKVKSYDSFNDFNDFNDFIDTFNNRIKDSVSRSKYHLDNILQILKKP